MAGSKGSGDEGSGRLPAQPAVPVTARLERLQRTAPPESIPKITPHDVALSHGVADLGAAFVEHAAELRRFLIGVLGDVHLAADCLQTAFAKALAQPQPIDASKLKAWLFQVAYREALACRRREQVHQRAIDELSAQLAEADPDLAEHLSRDETSRRVQQALTSLPEEQQIVVRLRVFEQTKFAEIAQRLEVPLGTVLTRMRLALKRLHSAMQNLDR